MTRALAAAAALAAALALETAASEGAGSCPVTTAKPARPGTGSAPASFNYGNDELRVAMYWPRGTLPAGVLPDGGAYAIVNADGSIWAKVGWWRGIAGTLRISGRRLDRPAPPLHADVPDGYGARGFVPSGLTFPTLGCWRVTGRLRAARLTFVVKVERVRSGSGPR